MDILTKQQMTEEDIKLNFITPALLNKGWQNKITMETAVKLTDGKVNLKGNLTFREPARRPTIFSISVPTIPLPWWRPRIITTAFPTGCSRP